MKVALVLGFSLLAACSSAVPAGPPLTVEKYLAQCDALLGKPVRVAGYLAVCQGYDCHLTVGPGQSKSIVDRWIGIGGGWWFDRKAASFQNSYVVITGRVDDAECTGESGLDRAYGIIPADIRTWTPIEGAPTNRKREL